MHTVYERNEFVLRRCFFYQQLVQFLFAFNTTFKISSPVFRLGNWCRERVSRWVPARWTRRWHPILTRLFLSGCQTVKSWPWFLTSIQRKAENVFVICTSCRVHLDQHVISSGFDQWQHHFPDGHVDWQRRRESLVVWRVNLVQYCTPEQSATALLCCYYMRPRRLFHIVGQNKPSLAWWIRNLSD